MADNKVHPSELMEFVSVSPQPTSRHIEQRKEKDPELPGTVTIATSNDSKIEDDGSYNNLELNSESLLPIGGRAFQANQSEHRLTLRQGLRLYPKAIAWSAMISLAIIMEGYDTALVNNLYAFKEFQTHYGVRTHDGQYQIESKWQAALSNGSTTGSIIGLFINGLMTQRFGYRYTMMGSLFMLAAFIFGSFFAFNIQTLLASQILCGLPWGVFSTLTTTYAAEVMPMNLRAYLTSIVNLCWLIGQITALGILRGLINWDTTWSYRIPFGLQWIWIVFVLTGTYFAPESPWWLLQHDRKEEAEKVLNRLTRPNLGFNAANTIAMMEHTNDAEKYFNTKDDTGKRRFNDTSYFECFRGSNLRRTEIACVVFVSQNLCGLPIIGYAAYLYTQVGFGEVRSYDLTLGMQGLAIVAGLLSLVLMRYLGRRTMFLWGLGLCLLILTAAGIMSTLSETPGTLWATAGLLIALIFVFDLTVGPITYVLVAELPSTRLRVKTLVLARVSYNISGIITNILVQRMINPLAWNWRGKTCFFCAVTCGASLIYCYFRLPEMRGLGFHEIDILFEKGAGARKFAKLQKVLEENSYYSFREEPGSGSEVAGRRRSFIDFWH